MAFKVAFNCYIDLEIAEKLKQEPNQSAVVRQALTEYYERQGDKIKTAEGA